MNERIRELVKQAGGIYHNDDGDELTPALVGKGLEKFAELVVKECLMLNAKELSAAAQFRMFDIYWDHFGLKE